VVKINWNAALDITNKKMGVGVTARDAEGFVLASMCATLSFITDPIVEAGAIWKAVIFCGGLEAPMGKY
jgi:hypothetical protein